MMEKNTDIFLAVGGSLLYLVQPIYKKYSTKFVWGYPFCTYVSYDRVFNSRPPIRTCAYFGLLPHSPSCVPI